jgi:hypothetical protein
MDLTEYINELFADSLYQEFNRDRFGLKSCKKKLDSELAYDMKTLYERAKEREECGIVDTDCCCSLKKLEEQINTL